MAPRATRASAPKTAKAPSSPSKIDVKRVTRVDNEQHRLFILPQGLSAEARITSLPNPASQTPCRYLYCPQKGVFEFTKTSSSRSTPSSWLIAGGEGSTQGREADASISRGYVLEDSSLFVATPIDPLFFLMPLFVAQRQTGKVMFRMEDDYIETLSSSTKSLARMLRRTDFRRLLVQRLETVSQVQDLGDEKVYKPDMKLLLKALLAKSKRMTDGGSWPKSLEEAFVRKQLEVSIVRERQIHNQLPTPEDSQNSLACDIEGKDDDEAATVSTEPCSAEVVSLMRSRVAWTFLSSSYVPPQLRGPMSKLLEEENAVYYAPLNKHLEMVQKSKTEAQALRSLSDNISRKRGLDDDEAADIRAEKKRKKEEEDQRKKSESRGIKQLKKVNVSGMQKLSSFFTKAPTKAGNAAK